MFLCDITQFGGQSLEIAYCGPWKNTHLRVWGQSALERQVFQKIQMFRRAQVQTLNSVSSLALSASSRERAQ